MRDFIAIAVDTMGGDYGPSVVIEAVSSSLKRFPNLRILLAGPREQLLNMIPSHVLRDRISFLDASDVVHMDDKPAFALRYRLNSSMALALQAVRDGHADACVSAGNTGALMALGRLILKTPSGIDRPAIIKRIPSLHSRCYVLDLGANVDCSAEHLYQFGVLGSILVEVIEKKPSPRIALLNVGIEDIKGNEQVRLAAHLFESNASLNFVGSVEGNDIFRDVADVVVCDGFVGNVALKASEGVITMLSELIENAFRAHWYGRILAWLAKPVLGRLKELLDPATHNGASLVGLNGVVIKSHGAAKEKAFASAIAQAYKEAKLGVPKIINAKLDDLAF